MSADLYKCFATKDLTDATKKLLLGTADALAKAHPDKSVQEVARMAADATQKELTRRYTEAAGVAAKQIEIRDRVMQSLADLAKDREKQLEKPPEGLLADARKEWQRKRYEKKRQQVVQEALTSIYAMRTNYKARQDIVNIESAQKMHLDNMTSLMNEAIYTFHKRWAGLANPPKDIMRQVGRALSGQTEGVDEGAVAMAKQIRKALNYEFSGYVKRGVKIGYEKNYLPTRHDDVAVVGDGSAEAMEAWIEAITPKLDWANMTARKDADLATDAGRREVLEAIWTKFRDKDFSDAGFAKNRKPMADRIRDSRFFHWKSYDDWDAYNQVYGGGEDLMTALAKHLHRASLDLATIDAMGLDPYATHEFVKNIARSLGGSKAEAAIERAHNVASGAIGVPENEMLAKRAEDVRAVLSASSLGSAILAAVPSDAIFAGAARALTGRNALSVAGDYVNTMSKLMGSEEGAKRMIQLGLMSDYFMAGYRGSDRALGEIDLSKVAHKVSDASMRLSLLAQHTSGMIAADGLNWRIELANYSTKAWGDLAQTETGSRFKNTLHHYGITEADWGKFQKYAADNTSGVMEDVGNGVKLFDLITFGREVDSDLGTKLYRMVATEGQAAVPQANFSTRAALTRGTRAGSIEGEFMRQATQWMGWPVAVWQGQIQRRLNDVNFTTQARAAQLAGLSTALLFGGYLSVQAGQIAQGKRPMSFYLDDGSLNTTLFARVASMSGFMGVYSDILFRDMQSHGVAGGVASLAAGPMLSTTGQDIYDLTGGAIWAMANGDEVRYGRRVVDAMKDHTPLSSHFWARGIGQRLVYDSLLEFADPRAYDVFSAKERYARESGTEYYLRPGTGLEGLFE